MAALASIPEAHPSSHSTFDTHRRRSRVVFLSSRARPRFLTRKSILAKDSAFRSRRDDIAGMAASDKSTKSNTTTSSSWTKFPSNPAPVAPDPPRHTESPFDLSAFPQPPVNNSYIRPPRPPRSSVCRSGISNSAPKPPLALVKRKLLSVAQQRPAPARRSLRDAAVDLVNPSNHQSVDSALAAAVSRSIAQQLHLFSTLQHSKKSPSRPSSSSKDSASSVSSQHRHLNRYTRDLEAYAEKVAAKGKIVRDASGPTVDAATVRTIPELLPYRSQLRAAGLAVTSKEQAKNVPQYLKDLHPTHSATKFRKGRRRQPTHAGAAQLDGKGDSGPSQSSGTEISFAGSQDTDAMRRALVDEVPSRKTRRPPKRNRRRRHCLPCFTAAEDDFITDTDWTHFRVPIVDNVSAARKRTHPVADVPRTVARMPPRVATQNGSLPPSPRYRSVSKTETAVDNESPSLEWDRPNFIITGRRHSMTMPRTVEQSIIRNARLREKESKAQGKSISSKSRPRPGAQVASYDSTRGASYDRAQPLPETVRDCNTSSATRPRVQINVPLRTEATTQRRSPRTAVSETPSFPKHDMRHAGICCLESRGIPPRLTARPNIPRRTSSKRSSMTSVELDYDDREIEDRDVLRGLHVAASAACDEEIDAFVRNRTGLRIRRFLADLMALETLTALGPGEQDAQHARRRRAEIRKLRKQVRRSREIALAGGLV